MPRQLREPTVSELPQGPRRDFALYLHELWRGARRPDLRSVADAVRAGDYPGSTSREQIRRMLWGLTVPSRWENLEAVFEVLCRLGQVDPDKLSPTIASPRRHLMELWNAALDVPPSSSAHPRPKPARIPTRTGHPLR